MSIVGKLHALYSTTDDPILKNRIENIYAYRRQKRKKKQALRVINFQHNEVIPVRQKILNTHDYVIVDGEFEGIEMGGCRRTPLEFSICIVRNDTVVSVKRYILGGKKKPRTVYKKAEIFQNVTKDFLIEELRTHLSGLPIVGYNISMEQSFLKEIYLPVPSGKKKNRSSKSRKKYRPYTDLIDIARAVQVINDMCQISHPSLCKALDDRNLPHRGLHNSANDVYYQYLMINDIKSDEIYQWKLPADV